MCRCARPPVLYPKTLQRKLYARGVTTQRRLARVGHSTRPPRNAHRHSDVTRRLGVFSSPEAVECTTTVFRHQNGAAVVGQAASIHSHVRPAISTPQHATRDPQRIMPEPPRAADRVIIADGNRAPSMARRRGRDHRGLGKRRLAGRTRPPQGNPRWRCGSSPRSSTLPISGGRNNTG